MSGESEKGDDQEVKEENKNIEEGESKQLWFEMTKREVKERKRGKNS